MQFDCGRSGERGEGGAKETVARTHTHNTIRYFPMRIDTHTLWRGEGGQKRSIFLSARGEIFRSHGETGEGEM